jgi:DeoR/GlpR family transcriptional regulator of sugar metabolism
MLTEDRKSLLLTRLAGEGRLIARNLAAELAVSEDTIRRDLRDLASDGLLTRVHGGALPTSPTHRPLAQRRPLHTAAKAQLARKAASLITPGMTVILDGGTTHLALITQLPPTLPATIITHSPPIAAALEHHANIEVILIGGTIYRLSMVALGATTQLGFARLHADLCLLGLTGLHPDAGLTTGNFDEAQIKAQMIRSAAKTIVLVTPDKIATASPFQIAPLNALHTLVSTEPRPDWLPATTTHLQA